MTNRDVIKLINSCTFLDNGYREAWADKVKDLKPYAIELVYKKFKDAKNRIESVYLKIAIKNDSTGTISKEIINVTKNVQ